MFTQCPQCLAAYPIKAAQLRKHHGLFRCKSCDLQFDALPTLSEKAPEKTAAPTPMVDASFFLETATAPATSNKLWTIGTAGGMILLLTQVAYFEHRNLMNNAQVRPLLEKLCAPLSCRLPVYRSSKDLTIVNSALQMGTEQHYQLRALVLNRAGFAQYYPRLKLTLLDVDGEAFAARIFARQEYLPQAPQTLFAANSEADVNLAIAAPELAVGGYLLELL